MSSDMTKDEMADTPYGKIALKKFGAVSSNFRLYEASWFSDSSNNRQVMMIRGADFRIAKSGSNKGKLSILVKGTIRKTFVSVEEMQNKATVESALIDDLVEFIIKEEFRAMDIREVKRFTALYNSSEENKRKLIDFVYALNLKGK